ncbi:MAG: MGMT family protein [Patescibacteria group bacterium]
MYTDFQKKVWRACRRIPKGKVTTYKLLAKAINRPKASRAVGQALNKNPFAPAVPCHRVIKSDGRVGGFAFGKRRKMFLLKKEGLETVNDKIVRYKTHLVKFR